ncbi:hypothetical protein [Pseudidiomarina salinarum]|uniref:hypothetical protein n=1 Tax=Pseudidiomarina salinarum TaxID=435908 RepID=UPI0006916681|nr:hypothetical protein [Pseudidiomarina salinarum]RUO69252.1 hypothetical protein CWI79_10130 [Pseudidiomarina salinarum]
MSVLNPLCVALIVTGAAIAAPVNANTFSTDDIDLDLSFRYRLEQVNTDAPLQDALASSLRSRVKLTTASYNGFSALAEIDNVSYIGGETFNNTVNGKTDYAVIADPDGTDINQVALRYQHDKAGTFTLGRQQINHLNQRFLGGVGWRQNEQTFDGYRWQFKASEQLQLELAHLDNVNRIFGPNGANADQRGDFRIALGQWQFAAGHRLALFGYDFDFRDWDVRDSLTTGIDYSGSFTVAPDHRLTVQLAGARQTDQYQAPVDFTHNYHRISGGWTYQSVTVELGQERLAGNGQTAFQTPLATLHAFQGFTDLFLVTPAAGIRDNWLKLNYQSNWAKFAFGYHEFGADAGNSDYGQEFNVSVSKPLTKQLAGLLKAARYEADSFGSDTSKLWFQLVYTL